MSASCDLTQCSYNQNMKCISESLELKTFGCNTCGIARVVCMSNDFRGSLCTAKKKGGQIENPGSITEATERNEG